MIQIGFSTSNAWYSKVIKWFTKSHCSHTFVIIDVLGVPMVLEEGYHGYAMRPMSVFPDNIVQVITPKVDITAAVQASFKDLGQSYGYSTLIGMLPVMVARWFGKKIKNPLASSRSMICSERNTRILQAAGYPGANELDPATTDPETLMEFLCST